MQAAHSYLLPGLCSLPTAAPCHPARPTEPTAAPVAARTEQPPGDPECLHCLHTHLARDSTQITLIHFKPTLSPEALQQILLKPCLHNVGRPSRPGTPGVNTAISETWIEAFLISVISESELPVRREQTQTKLIPSQAKLGSCQIVISGNVFSLQSGQ